MPPQLDLQNEWWHQGSYKKTRFFHPELGTLEFI